jgi:hypothetical protein
VKDQLFTLSVRQRDAIASCLRHLDQAQVDLEVRHHQDGKDDRIMVAIETCRDGLQTVLNALQGGPVPAETATFSADELDQEFRALEREHDTLEREHARLNMAPFERQEHRDHSMRLQVHMARLRRFTRDKQMSRARVT